MTPKGYISQALALQASYLVLDGAKKNNNFPSGREELISTGLHQSSTIILVFAIEIALKGLLKLRFGSFRRTHDLKKLYDDIPLNNRKRISEIYKSKLERTDSTLESLLELHKSMFVDLRYLDGFVNVVPNLKFLSKALDSIVNYYNEVKVD